MSMTLIAIDAIRGIQISASIFVTCLHLDLMRVLLGSTRSHGNRTRQHVAAC